MKSNVRSVRCIYCLKLTETSEADHVFPASWYPDSTPPTIQRWTVPSCPKCNRTHGQLEKDLLVRLVLSTDPNSSAASGLAGRVFRSLGLDVADLPENEKAIRDKLRAKLRSELIPYAEVAELPERIPGLGPGSDEPQGPPLLIPYAGLAMMAEKIARGCEYRYNKRHRIVEHPYGVRILMQNQNSGTPETFLTSEVLDLGPGCQIRRVCMPERDPDAVGYWIEIWDALHFIVLIDLEENLVALGKEAGRPSGTLQPTDRAMQVPEYLRSFTEQALGKE